MTSKLKCPFCEYELQENRTTNLCCPICGLVAPTKLWQALMQAKQDLVIAIKGIKTLGEYDPYKEHLGIDTIAQNILEQIEHKE